jgi:hypothetical protein
MNLCVFGGGGGAGDEACAASSEVKQEDFCHSSRRTFDNQMLLERRALLACTGEGEEAAISTDCNGGNSRKTEVEGTGGSSRCCGEPILLERRVRRVFDRNGRCWQRVTCFRPVTPAEYDAHCAACAAAGRPPSLQWLLGDRRTGAQLLGDAAADRRLSLARLCGSQRGRRYLDQLAVEVRRRFESVIQAAANEEEDVSWALGMIECPWPPPPPPSSPPM